jgi:hypothetical protein
MTWLTKMSISPAKPLSNATTKFTFELNEVFPMFWAIFDWYLAAVGTNQLFSFK